MRAPDRQRRRAVCTSAHMMPVLVSLLCATAAQAEVGVEILIELDRATVPANVTLTASTSSDDPIVEYRWSGLDFEPACSDRTCNFDVHLASCRRVAIEVTTVFGERAQNTGFVCVGGANGAPPRAEIRVENRGDAVWVVPSSSTGSSAVALTRLWIDRGEVEGAESTPLPSDRGCHAVDLLVADLAGRFGIDRRTICQSSDAPRPQLAARPDFCPQKPQAITLCGRTDHPLGANVSRVSGDAPFMDCDVEEQAPSLLRRRFVVVRDDAGLESTASILICSSAPGAETLFFSSFPDVGVATRGSDYVTRVGLHGGRAPFSGLAHIEAEDGTRTRGEAVSDNGALDLVWRSIALPAGRYTLTATVTDADGFRAFARAPLEVTKSFVNADGGVVDNPPQSADGGFGCATARGASSFELLLLALLLKRRRR